MTDAELQEKIDELAADIAEFGKTMPKPEDPPPPETDSNPWR